VDRAVNKSSSHLKEEEHFSEITQSINVKIMEFIALDNQPFSVVGDVGLHDWSSTGTHNQVRYFSDVALPELHSNIVTAISFATYYGTPFGSLRVKKDTCQITLFDNNTI
jgi:hypothetical protein